MSTLPVQIYKTEMVGELIDQQKPVLDSHVKVSQLSSMPSIYLVQISALISYIYIKYKNETDLLNIWSAILSHNFPYFKKLYQSDRYLIVMCSRIFFNRSLTH